MEGRAISGDIVPIRSLVADNFYRMSARKLVYRFMVCSPALFLAGIGVHARGLVPTFEPLANDPKTEKQILSYVPYLRESRAFLNRSYP